MLTTLPHTLLGYFRVVAFVEGVSFVALLLIGMPLKYAAGTPIAVRILGMAHGVLFIVYAVLVALLLSRRTFSFARAMWAMLMSLIPLGTFVLDRQLARDLAAHHDPERP